MKFVAQFLIVLITTNTSIVRGEKLLDTINLTPENTTLTNTGRSLESNLKTVVKFANKAKFTESASKLHLQNDGLEREVKEFTRNFVKNSSEQMPEELPNSLRNMNLAESNLVRIVLRNNSKQEEIKDIKEKLEIAEESSANMEKLQNPLPVEKQNETSTASSQEGERTASQTLMRTITPIRETSDTQKDPNESLRSVVATQTSELVSKGNLAANLQLAKNNTAKQGDRGSIASALPRVEKINKYEISLLRSNLTEDKNIGNQIHTNKQEVKEDSLNNLQQFWNENPSQNINEYEIEPKLFNSNENTRNSILAQSELIEIILKEATYLNKKQAENAILELNSTATSKSTSKTSNNFEKSSCNLTESDLVQKSLKDETNSIQQGDRKDSSLLESTTLNNNSNLNRILYTNADGLQNYSTDSNKNMEEKFMNSSDSQVDKTTFPSEGTKLILQSLNSFMGVQTYNTTETKLESTSLNKLQEVKDLILTEFLEETAPTPDASNELTTKPLNSFKGHQNSNVTANEWKEEDLNKVINLNTTQKENDLINKETIAQLATSLVPANEINLKTLPNRNVAQNESYKTALEFVKNFDKTQEEKSLNFLEPVVKNVSSILAFIEMITEPLNSFKGPKNYNQTEVELRKAILEGFQNSNKTRQQNNLNSFESLAQAASPPSAKELTFEPYNRFKEQQNYNKAESKMKEIVLKEFVNSNKMQRENNSDSLKSSAELTNTPIENLKLAHKQISNILKGPQSINGTENKLEKTALKEIKNLNETQEAVNLNSLELLTKTNATSGAVNQLTPITSFKEKQNSTKSEQEPDHPEKLINFNTKQEKTNLSYKTSLEKSTSTTKAVIELNPEPLNKLNEPENSRATTKISMPIDNQQYKELLNAGQQSEEKKEYFAERDTSSSSNDNEMETDSTPKNLITLEEYAVKQMNFILDHLLIETQEFVAKVLQATINSVFPRDHLKHYAEGVNRVLNPITESDYSDEIFESQTASQDKIYEQIIEKLNFLKSKPSKYLQKQIPPEWLDEFRDRRTELAIWLDKATEQMHKEFVYYITEEEDPIKYQYFNETFDDISRATEIHHKLALLADLVKIVKNKKQITFMDLYMQT